MRAVMRRLESQERWWAAEIGVRLIGLALLGIAAANSWLLRRFVLSLPAHGATAGEFALAAAAVAAFTLGCAFTAEGPGLFRLLPVPARNWIL